MDSALPIPGISTRSGFRLRQGQELFLRKLAGAYQRGEYFHLGVFVPGYGKTITALASFLVARACQVAERLVVFVPRGNLRDQYADSSELSKTLSNLGGPSLSFCVADSDRAFLKNPNTDIVITTYQYAAGSGGHVALRDFCQQSRCLFVFDEVHHLSDEGTWATKIREFRHSASIALSGTPMRSDKKTLFGVPFESSGEEQFYTALHEVSLMDAHTEGQILKRVSVHISDYSVQLRNVETGEMVALSLSQIGDAVGESGDVDAFLARKNLRFHSVYLEKLLDPAFAMFRKKRQMRLEPTEPFLSGTERRNHQMLVIAMSNQHSAAILEFIRERYPGLRTARIGQDVPAKEREGLLQGYRRGTIDVMVQVDMIGEGTDIKAISVIVKADLVRAISKTLQQVFRGMRYYNEFSEDENVCDIYASNDAELVAILEWIANQEKLGFSNRISSREFTERTTERVQKEARWELQDVEHLANATHDLQLFPEHGSSTARVVSTRKLAAKPSKPENQSVPQEVSVSQVLDISAKEQELRNECSSLTSVLARMLQASDRRKDARYIHAEARRKFRLTQEEMNIEMLEKKKVWLLECIKARKVL